MDNNCTIDKSFTTEKAAKAYIKTMHKSGIINKSDYKPHYCAKHRGYHVGVK